MKFFTDLFIFILLLSPLVLFAQTPQYNPLVGLPGLNGEPLSASSDFNALINALYAIAIAVAALLAVIKVIIAGVKWMLTDIVTSKEEAKKDIKGALLGLLIVLSAVLILTVINPNLVNVDLSKTVMGEDFVPMPPPTPRSALEQCDARGGTLHSCPTPPSPRCTLPGGSQDITCDSSLINSCAKGTTCVCTRSVSGANEFGQPTYSPWNCATARNACIAGGGTPSPDPIPEGTTSINCT